MDPWTSSSWRAKPAVQQPVYPSADELAAVLADLARMPPLVTPWEIDTLKSQLVEAAAGRRFLLEGGDCAERFADCDACMITDKLKVLLQMSLVLIHGSKRAIIRVGRFAGQYAKP
ncbi:MAG TPA: 3-deoxy-7-phosphoheptulonate synthase, partial [Bryobacteraceae bacterium]|nr:3-deoxy-7-phosphoheptulonate synthase [Bryobacteraceae bacterium]